jgi:hypothetical protein
MVNTIPNDTRLRCGSLKIPPTRRVSFLPGLGSHRSQLPPNAPLLPAGRQVDVAGPLGREGSAGAVGRTGPIVQQRKCISPARQSISATRPLAGRAWRAPSEWRSPAAPLRLIDRNCREPSVPERQKDRSVELRTSIVVSMARNQPTCAGSAPDDGCDGERHAATSTSSSLR